MNVKNTKWPSRFFNTLFYLQHYLYQVRAIKIFVGACALAVIANLSACGGGGGGGSSPPANQPPTALFGVSLPTSVLLPAEVSFTSNSTDSDGSIASASWNFGDGATGSGNTISHQFTSNGSYEVVLTVRDDDGAVATTMQTIEIQDPACSFGTRELNDCTLI